MPGTTLPTAVGADGNTYSADSSDENSPWLESMVFPENPSGVIKTPQLPDSSRRVCDVIASRVDASARANTRGSRSSSCRPGNASGPIG